MDDATRRHWEQIADDTIDRAIAAAIADLKGSGPEPEAADLRELLLGIKQPTVPERLAAARERLREVA